MASDLCKKCGLPGEFRTRKKRGKTVVLSTCKECEKAYNRTYHLENREIVLARLSNRVEKDRTCTVCLLPKKKDEFHRLATQCKSCRKPLGASSYSENKEELNAQGRDRVKRINDGIFCLLGDTCGECDESEREFLTVDHVNNDRQQERHPNSLIWKLDILEGRRDLSSYRVLCRNCNEARQRRNPTQLLKPRPLVGRSKDCQTCGEDLDLSFFYARGNGTWKNSCSLCMRRAAFKTAESCYRLLGGACRCCNVSDPFKLHVDHVHDDGSVRRRLGEKTGTHLYEKILRGELNLSDFQVLCANCNYSKMRHGGICLHSLMTSEVA